MKPSSSCSWSMLVFILFSVVGAVFVGQIQAAREREQRFHSFSPREPLGLTQAQRALLDGGVKAGLVA